MNDTSTSNAVCFTDGSSRGNPGPGGWGSVVAFADRVVELGGYEKETTNNRMELLAIAEGIARAADMGASSVVVATDSTYALKGATAWMRGWKSNGWKTKTKDDVANVDLWKMIDAAMSRVSTRFVMVSGHVGTPGNERCDRLATAFADGDEPALYDGSLAEYPIHIVADGEPVATRSQDLADKKAKAKSGSRSGTAYSYISMVGGVVQTHATWKECEARVKGVSGTRFKKSLSASDEAEIIADFKKSAR